MKPEKYSDLNKKVAPLKVILNDEKSFDGKYFNVKFSNILKKATKSKECYAGLC